MPPLPDVHHVLKVVHEGTVNGEPWVGVSHWRFVPVSGELSSDNVRVICAKFVNSWRDNWKPLFSNECIDQFVEGIDLTSTTAATGVAPDGDAGDTPQLARSPETCFLVSKVVGLRYRGGHPRTYWPGIPRDDVADGRSLASGTFADYATATAAYYGDIPPAVTTDGDSNCSSFHEVMVSYYSGGTRRVVPVVADILGYTPHQVVATQRRRLHRV